jgi:phospholipid/cholesterol/gamma-HCH transport system permease protein
MNAAAIAKPMNAVGEFFVFSLESLAAAGGGVLARRELPEQILFVARVSFSPIDRRTGRTG